MNHYVITFNSINDALKAEKLTADFGGTIIPIPSEISSDCGFALRLNEFEAAECIIKTEFDSFEIFKVSGKGINRTIEAV